MIFILDAICSDASEIGGYSEVNYVSFTLYFEVIINIIIIYLFFYTGPIGIKAFLASPLASTE